ncbi:hypothetical protein [Qipengyuania soli]|uniref:Lipoprotein n=1 Tax=Qipengyuania soli TaxID=2782568 RepID=A0A7S8IV77_9SPHN|nr:hypothetical protein [Qipengyuania soli]QPC99829.1 hypothetical protein IRL76_04625 [Qipengyuania soli]
MTTTRTALAALALASSTLAACVVVPDAPNVIGTPWNEGTPVPLGQPVKVADIVVTPIRVVEDSRCPINARCVWAGRLVVETRIDGAGWRDTANITLGETYGTHEKVVRLIAGEPNKTTQEEIKPNQYRFTYEDGAWYVEYK